MRWVGHAAHITNAQKISVGMNEREKLLRRTWHRAEYNTRQTMHVKRNTEARSYNHCCSGKAISMVYSECVSVTLVIQRAMRMRHIVICGLSGWTVFFQIIS
jgi:hypothetical protein